MRLIRLRGEMWARNDKNIRQIPDGEEGVYVLYDGSTPVYVGKGILRQRIKDARKSKRRGQLWDHFSWYVLNNMGLMHDVEVLLLRLLPPFLHILNRQEGHFQSGRKLKYRPVKEAEPISRKARMSKKK